MLLQDVTTEEIAQYAKDNDDRKTIITEELNSHLEGLL